MCQCGQLSCQDILVDFPNSVAVKEHKKHPYVIGANYMFRTVTMCVTGQLVEVYKKELVLVQAAWVADTGRYAQAVESGTFDEVEPYPAQVQVIVNRGSIVDCCQIPTLPLEQK